MADDMEPKGCKRAFADTDSKDSQHSHSPFSKKAKFSGRTKHNAKEGSSEWMKKRVRTIERLFQSGRDLPADVRNELERELEAHRSSLASRSFQKKRSDMISKYHMVRFFDKKKAIRLVKQLKRQIAATEDAAELDTLRQQLHIAQVDEAYAQHHPHCEPYISIYAKSAETKGGDEDKLSAAKAALGTKRPPMWTTVEGAMSQGDEALRQLRERPPLDGSSTGKSAHRSSARTAKSAAASESSLAAAKLRETAPATVAKPKDRPRPGQQPLNRRERRKLMREALPDINASDDDDGGGFFEGE